MNVTIASSVFQVALQCSIVEVFEFGVYTSSAITELAIVETYTEFWLFKMLSFVEFLFPTSLIRNNNHAVSKIFQ